MRRRYYWTTGNTARQRTNTDDPGIDALRICNLSISSHEDLEQRITQRPEQRLGVPDDPEAGDIEQFLNRQQRDTRQRRHINRAPEPGHLYLRFATPLRDGEIPPPPPSNVDSNSYFVESEQIEDTRSHSLQRNREYRPFHNRGHYPTPEISNNARGQLRSHSPIEYSTSEGAVGGPHFHESTDTLEHTRASNVSTYPHATDMHHWHSQLFSEYHLPPGGPSSPGDSRHLEYNGNGRNLAGMYSHTRPPTFRPTHSYDRYQYPVQHLGEDFLPQDELYSSPPVPRSDFMRNNRWNRSATSSDVGRFTGNNEPSHRFRHHPPVGPNSSYYIQDHGDTFQITRRRNRSGSSDD